MDDLISEFITETSESLSVLDLELVKLEQNPNDKEILGNIFRLVHTIKGTCGFLGLPRLESVAHAGENVLGKIRDDEIEVTPEAISIVLESLDHIKDLMEYLSENGEEPEGDDTDLIKRLNAFAAGGGTPVAEVEAPAPEPEPVIEEEPIEMPVKPSEEASDDGLGIEEVSLEELERIFQETEVTVEGGMTAPSAADSTLEEEPEEELLAEPQVQTPPPVAPAPKHEPKEDISAKAKETALKKGLAADPNKDAGGASLANQSIRVNLQVLENLMQMVGELVLTRNQLLQVVRNRDDNELKAPLQHLSHITTELQEGVMKTRMQPIGNAWAKFPRLIRDLSIELGKKIELRMVGAETELDRQLLDMIKDPLTHMVRNSCDHGLEGPEERAEASKPETGTVTLKAFHEGGHIIIEISDDGRGVNIERVRSKAIENGIATENDMAMLTDKQIMQFIFKPGFSTAEKVTSVSGRGVGMDVVRTNIEKIGGTVELSSEPGKGSVFHIKIPLTLAIVSVLIVEANKERFAIPQLNVLELVRSAEDSEHVIEMINNAKVLRLRDKLLPLTSLSDILQLPEPLEVDDPEMDDFGSDLEEHYIVVCKVGGNEFGIVVDRIFDTEEIVVKPVSSMLSQIPVYSGNTILGDGSVIMILDPNGLARVIGEGDVGAGKSDAPEQNTGKNADKEVSFLVFNAGEGSPKAVPLELVSRLEEIDVSCIEASSGKPVIQYRDDLMRLVTLPCNSIPESGMIEVIVFTYDNKNVGLVVDGIADIVSAPLRLQLASQSDEYLGSMIIAEKTTDVVDVGYLLRDLVDDLTGMNMFEDRDKVENCHILLVEDSLFFRKLTIPLLENVGYEVTGVGHAKDALDLLDGGQKFDVVVTDIEMPDINGFEFAAKLRENTAYDALPIIAFTSTINQQFIARSQEIGMNDFILKTDREALIHAIAEQLGEVPQEVLNG